jgi:hypothetical protein
MNDCSALCCAEHLCPCPGSPSPELVPDVPADLLVGGVCSGCNLQYCKPDLTGHSCEMQLALHEKLRREDPWWESTVSVSPAADQMVTVPVPGWGQVYVSGTVTLQPGDMIVPIDMLADHWKA